MLDVARELLCREGASPEEGQCREAAEEQGAEHGGRGAGLGLDMAAQMR